VERPRTSLPRDDYLRAVGTVQHHIVRGNIYQANLCQRFSVGYEGKPLDLFDELSASTAAPHSAFIRTPDFSIASLSPETFLRMRSTAELETWPIKGTRPRGGTDESDLAAASELQSSAKDRAELVMIVDLERNDLSRVCEPGTVRVSELARLRSYATVHHLVAGVHGTLRDDVDVEALVRATFPGGSITGAPKLRAMEILHGLEPVRRGFFTGSLFWFGDDGSLDSSILIRTLVFNGRQAFLGAGGGVVADSDAEQEWRESNHKARALAAALGFDPEEAV
jgi:aminodeoxychorismate synthase component I